MDRKLTQLKSSSTARQISLQRVFRAVLRDGPISRAELSRQLGLSKQTASDVVRELVEDGWLRTTGQTRGNIGRSATNYEVDSSRAYVLGGDLGGTKLSIALADLSGKICVRATELTDPSGGAKVIRQIVSLAGRLLAQAGIARASVFGGMIGVPGAYDERTDRLNLVPNISGLEDIPVGRMLSHELGFDVSVENDVNLAAKGELWQGTGGAFESFVFIAMGTGVGMGIISNGQIVRGVGGAAGEIASLPIGGDPFDGRTFSSGLLESCISSRAIVHRYAAYGGAAAPTVADIFDRWLDADPIADAVMNEVARNLAVAISAVAAIVNPALVVTGGSIGSRRELIDRVRKLLPFCMARPTRVEISKLGNDAALVGAIGAALDAVREELFAV